MIQLLEIIGNKAGASNKARADVNIVANSMGFETRKVLSPATFSTKISKYIGKFGFEHNLKKELNRIENGSTLLVQVPFLNLANRTHTNILNICSKKGVKVICFIHDINELRGTNAENNQPFYELLSYASAVISHNKKMTEHLITKGIQKKRIIDLEVFDYLLDTHEKVSKFRKQIIIGGNLDVEKVQYLKSINRIKGCKIVLYGPNYSLRDEFNNIEYRGVVPADELPYKLDEGFGLVWDGDSIETCNGLFGNYLRYNNPHKLSMYLASGLPVIIWNQAAEASFVKENGLGITVESLLEMEDIFNNLTEIEYDEYERNVHKIRTKIISGCYAREALEKALNIINNKEICNVGRKK